MCIRDSAATGAENIVNTAIGDIEAEGEKHAAAIASSGTQALEAIGQVEQTVIAQVQAAGTTQVSAVEDAGDGKIAEINTDVYKRQVQPILQIAWCM